MFQKKSLDDTYNFIKFYAEFKAQFVKLLFSCKIERK